MTPQRMEVLLKSDGYLVPNHTNIIIAKPQGSDKVKTRMSVTTLRPNFEKQKDDVVFAIESRFGKDIANEVRKHIEPKKERWDYLPEKYIYVEGYKSVYMDSKVTGF